MLGLFSDVFAQKVALNFDGSDDFVSTTTPAITGNNARTLEAWVRTTANCDPNSGGKQKVIADMGDQKNGHRFTLNILWGNTLRIEVSGGGLNGKTAINDGKWHHVAVSYDPSATNNFKLFVDDSLENEGNIGVTINTMNTNNLVIGRRIDGVNHFDGDIDEVRLWDHARTDSAIIADRNLEYCTSKSGLIAHYKLNEGDPGKKNTGKTTATDYSKSGKKGTLTYFNLDGSSSNWITGSNLKGGDTRDTLKVFDCNSYTRPSGKIKYTYTGIYEETIPNAAGCDSIITLDVTIGKSNSYMEVDACDSFIMPRGRIVYTSGYHEDTFSNGNSFGCDSLVLVKVKIRKKAYTADTMTFCDAIELDGKWYTTSQIVELQRTNRFGCDSIHSVTLVALKSTSSMQVESACDVYVSPSGKNWTATGTYYDTLFNANQIGCDSIINIDLTLNKSFEMNIPVESCDSFVSPSGKTYFTEGEHVEYFTSPTGCDSTLKYRVTIYSSETSNSEMEVCDSAMLGGKWYYESRPVSIIWENRNGCDSVENVDLTIISIDTTVVRSGNELVAQQEGAQYQWVDCKTGNNISSAIGKIFYPEEEGEYAVDIKIKDCVKRSSCYNTSNVGIGERVEKRLKISPIPAVNRIKVDFALIFEESDFVIRDINGRVVQSGRLLSGDQIQLNSTISTGVYVLEVDWEGGVMRENFMVQ